MGVNSLPKTVTRQRHDCDLNPGPSVPESGTLTTRLPIDSIELLCRSSCGMWTVCGGVAGGVTGEKQRAAWACGAAYARSCICYTGLWWRWLSASRTAWWHSSTAGRYTILQCNQSINHTHTHTHTHTRLTALFPGLPGLAGTRNVKPIWIFCAYHRLLLALLDVSYSGALQISRWLIDWLNWVVGCWRGYLSGARCRLAYGPADATATHCLLLQ